MLDVSSMRTHNFIIINIICDVPHPLPFCPHHILIVYAVWRHTKFQEYSLPALTPNFGFPNSRYSPPLQYYNRQTPSNNNKKNHLRPHKWCRTVVRHSSTPNTSHTYTHILKTRIRTLSDLEHWNAGKKRICLFCLCIDQHTAILALFKSASIMLSCIFVVCTPNYPVWYGALSGSWRFLHTAFQYTLSCHHLGPLASAPKSWKNDEFRRHLFRDVCYR